MNKSEFVKGFAEYAHVTQVQAREVFEQVMGFAVSELRTNGDWGLHDLVQITAVDVPERSGTSLGVAWTKPAHRALKAKIVGAGKRMFEEVR